LIIPLLLDLIGIIQIFLDFINNIYHKPIFVAEIGCNHKGYINLTKQLIVSAANCGAQYAKFQIKNNKYLLGDDYKRPHPVTENSYGKTFY
jgi:N-acetylneuraminate synthase